jgi:hypothetical protein
MQPGHLAHLDVEEDQENVAISVVLGHQDLQAQLEKK